jgi:hypothetical protein
MEIIKYAAAGIRNSLARFKTSLQAVKKPLKLFNQGCLISAISLEKLIAFCYVARH